MNKLTPEHIIKLAFIAGTTVVASVTIIFGYLAGFFLQTIGIISGVALTILFGYVMKKIMDI